MMKQIKKTETDITKTVQREMEKLAEQETQQKAQQRKNERRKTLKSNLTLFSIFAVTIMLGLFVFIDPTVYVGKDNDGTSESGTSIVYITETGEKYHRSNCNYLFKSKISIDLEEAKYEGYTPCSKCKPPKLN